MSDSPRLSVVVTARNDDHGGDLLRRMQIFVDGFLQQARRWGLDGELIIVEWNPPPDRARLADALRWPEEPGPCQVRIIEVSPEIHRRFQYADRLGLFQMIAKNVGIRRARGQYVLCTNVDVLFSDALMGFVASATLDADCMYRADRTDVSADLPLGVPIAEQLEFCRAHVLRVCTRWGTFTPGQTRWLAVLKRAVVKLVTQRSILLRLFSERVRSSARRLRRRFVRGLSVRRLWREVTHPLHTNACGDFTLLARERFFELRGYPELMMFSLHLDSVLCQMAAIGGAREVVLGEEMRLYHIEHGSGWSPGEAESLVARLAARGVPVLDFHQYRIWVHECLQRGSPIIFNDEDWGLARERLPEIDPIRQPSGLARVGPAQP